MSIKIYTFGGSIDKAFEEGGILHGFDFEVCGWDDVEANHDLYEALGVDPEDEEYMIGVHADGRFALVGLTMPGQKFAIKG